MGFTVGELILLFPLGMREGKRFFETRRDVSLGDGLSEHGVSWKTTTEPVQR